LNEVEFSSALNIPIYKYYDIISAEKEFYSKYLSQITSGGSLNSTSNIDKLRNDLSKSIEERNKEYFKKVAKTGTIVGSLGSGAISLISAATVISAPLLILAGILWSVCYTYRIN